MKSTQTYYDVEFGFILRIPLKLIGILEVAFVPDVVNPRRHGDIFCKKAGRAQQCVVE